MLPAAVIACMQQICDTFFRRVEWASTDAEPVPVDQADSSDGFERCLTVYYDETCGQYSHLQFFGAEVVPVGSLNPAAVEKMFRRNLELISNTLTGSSIFIAKVLDAIKPRLFKLTDFDSTVAAPVCDPNVCLELFRDTSLADDDCPGGRVTHACVLGTVVCFGGGGSGGDPGGNDPTATITGHQGSPSFKSPDVYCGPAGTVTGGFYGPLGADNPETSINEDQIEIAAGTTFVGGGNTYSAITTANSATSLEICGVITITGGPVNLEWFVLFDSSGNPVTPTSVVSPPGYPMSVQSDAGCGGETGVSSSSPNSIPDGTYPFCITYPVGDDDYEWVARGIAGGTVEVLSGMTAVAT